MFLNEIPRFGSDVNHVMCYVAMLSYELVLADSDQCLGHWGQNIEQYLDDCFDYHVVDLNLRKENQSYQFREVTFELILFFKFLRENRGSYSDIFIFKLKSWTTCNSDVSMLFSCSLTNTGMKYNFHVFNKRCFVLFTGLQTFNFKYHIHN